jgi:hypothetical protein
LLFSQRSGLKPVKQTLQLDYIDNDLKNKLWNALGEFFFNSFKNDDLVSYDVFGKKTIHQQLPLLIRIWDLYFKKPVDTMSSDGSVVYTFIRNYFFSCSWYEVYDFIEFLANTKIKANSNINDAFISVCNKILQAEISGYRFVASKITKITSDEEIESIEQAVNQQGMFNGAAIHLQTALKLLSDKASPDYRNSIKESISAVESVCIVISGDEKASLGKALKAIEASNKIELHASLKGAFEKLYGYTSDANGIRHALLEYCGLNFEDAKFMLVSCSAFVNYLVDKSKN